MQVFTIQHCSGSSFAPPADREAAVRPLVEQLWRLFAIVALPDDAPIFKFSNERGGYVVFLSSPSEPPGVVRLRTGIDGRILGIEWSCGETPATSLRQWSTTGRVVLEPLPAGSTALGP